MNLKTNTIFLSSICNYGSKIVNDAQKDELATLADTALKLIQECIFPDAARVNQSKSVNLVLSNMKIQHTVEPSVLMFEMDKNDLDVKRGRDSTFIRGFYYPSEGKIYLHRDYWCIKTAIHETLHACSITSVLKELVKYKLLYEGLTEFFAGYVLFKKYYDSYENCWRKESGMHCEMTYEQQASVWAALFHFIPMPYVINLYFASLFTNWKDETENFVKQIQSYGFKNFQNPFLEEGQASHLRLLKQCRKNLGVDFLKVYNSRELLTDFSNILLK